MPAIDYTFSGNVRQILITSGVTDVEVQDMYSRWKQWTQETDNSKYFQAFRTFGGDPTIAGQFAPKYFFLTNGWRVVVDYGEVSFGTNLYTDELEFPYIVGPGAGVSDRNSDAVVVDNGIAQSLDYNGIIHINQSIGSPGSIYPTGTIAQPSNNIIDSLVIAGNEGINKFKIHGQIDFKADVEGFEVEGGNIADVCVFQNYSINNTTFRECVLSGNSTGIIKAQSCQLKSGLRGVNGEYENCGIQGSLYVGSGTTISMINCSSMVPGSGSPSVFLSSDITLSFRKYSGGIGIYDSGLGSVSTFEFLAGNCKILTGNTEGLLVIRGIAGFTNQVSGSTIDSTELLIPSRIALQQSLNVNTEITKNK